MLAYCFQEIFLGNSLGFYTSAKGVFFLSNLYTFMSSSSFIELPRTSSEKLNRSGERAHLCVVPDLGERHPYLNPVSSMMVAADIL